VSEIINAGSKVKVKATGQPGKVKEFYQHRLLFTWFHVVISDDGSLLGTYTKKELEII
tara:strand:- start:167 stop:340 length:174 start_codon:yes stop_codon:yes gene_type:complete